MTSLQDRLQQLLDGDVDPAELADDPTLASLADRLYGIKIAAVQPVKPRDAAPAGAPAQAVTEVAPPTDMLVEVIAPEVMATPELPLPLPGMGLDMPPVPSTKRRPVVAVLGVGLTLVIVNIFGLFSSLFESMCETGTCRGPEQTRLNLMSPHKLAESDGWSYSILSESMSGVGGTVGGIGIPDIVALVVLTGGLFVLMRRK